MFRALGVAWTPRGRCFVSLPPADVPVHIGSLHNVCVSYGSMIDNLSVLYVLALPSIHGI